MVVAAVFTIKLRNDEAEQQFLDAFAPLQQHAVWNEPGTLTYELHQVFENGEPVPHQYLVLERYSSMRDFEEIHMKSAPLQNLFKAVAGIAVEEQKLTLCSKATSQPAIDRKPQVWPDKAIDDPLLQKGVLVLGVPVAATSLPTRRRPRPLPSTLSKWRSSLSSTAVARSV
ncbi:ysine_decarboxylase-like_protein (plasmid) [Leishmania braziliensis MHOM/BR/75/M2904]|uniref:Ysine_decarboxylase-like_protein n=1 Tax=Leishmania braziliensis MHOM/BR/75/M2904 TaxID=420245 RepID=A0A3P3Z349_LEIBR|nr:ysine_decarboxylase-like_protein [Leishmania braziliensis MHOM/BR/75/M2904]